MQQLLEIFNGSNTEIPIWFMRQAGRYLPEYHKIRKQQDDFINLCFDIEKATEITLQPIRRFNFDSAILFSDIMSLPHLLGWEVHFEKNLGPVLKKFEKPEDLKILNQGINHKIQNIKNIISNLREKLPKNVSLIGFAGAPWTIMSYMLEGRSKHNFEISKQFIYENKQLAYKLCEIITNNTIKYLEEQILSGAQIIQLFDSWAGMLLEDEYDEFVIEPTKIIVKELKSKYKNIPIIGFPRLSSYKMYQKYISNTNIDAISVDQFITTEYLLELQEKIIVQGNLDPILLLCNKEIIKEKLDKFINKINNKKLIFNLGHGILPKSKIDNVEYIVQYIKTIKF